jgi:hypothetical protein
MMTESTAAKAAICSRGIFFLTSASILAILSLQGRADIQNKGQLSEDKTMPCLLGRLYGYLDHPVCFRSLARKDGKENHQNQNHQIRPGDPFRKKGRLVLDRLQYHPATRCLAVIICGARPDIKEPSGFVLKLDRPLPEDGAADDLSTAASMVELEDGTICDYIAGATGAWDGVRSERINYSCRIKGQMSVIFGGLQRGEVWIAEKGVLVEQKTSPELPPWLVQDIRKVKIRTVWQ